jgi:hypothetical protein
MQQLWSVVKRLKLSKMEVGWMVGLARWSHSLVWRVLINLTRDQLVQRPR